MRSAGASGGSGFSGFGRHRTPAQQAQAARGEKATAIAGTPIRSSSLSRSAGLRRLCPICRRRRLYGVAAFSAIKGFSAFSRSYCCSRQLGCEARCSRIRERRTNSAVNFPLLEGFAHAWELAFGLAGVLSGSAVVLAQKLPLSARVLAGQPADDSGDSAREARPAGSKPAEPRLFSRPADISAEPARVESPRPVWRFPASLLKPKASPSSVTVENVVDEEGGRQGHHQGRRQAARRRAWHADVRRVALATTNLARPCPRTPSSCKTCSSRTSARPIASTARSIRLHLFVRRPGPPARGAACEPLRQRIHVQPDRPRLLRSPAQGRQRVRVGLRHLRPTCYARGLAAGAAASTTPIRGAGASTSVISTCRPAADPHRGRS